MDAAYKTKYTKPEAVCLGNIAALTQYLGPNYKTQGPHGDGPPPPHNRTTPAYDLDD
jgi:hypothetical protein